MTGPADLMFARAEHLLAVRRPAEAIPCFDEAEGLGSSPDCCASGRWNCHMLLGEYAPAWQESDNIRARGSYDPNRVWDGTPITGKRLFIRSVHGLGDAVQMLRYMPLVQQQAASVTLQVSPHLFDLANLCPGIDEVVPWEEDRPFDVQCEITELPYMFRSTVETTPAITPYLDLPASLTDAMRTSLGRSARPKVGLVWNASGWDRSRSLSLHSIRELIEFTSGIDFWSLQAQEDNIEWDKYCETRGWGLRCAGDRSLDQLAAAIASMDLVITVDTLAAHLAGALARHVWVLLKADADWRWMLEREDSPWYPKMRLFRQTVCGNWSDVITRVTGSLCAWRESAGSMTNMLQESAP